MIEINKEIIKYDKERSLKSEYFLKFENLRKKFIDEFNYEKLKELSIDEYIEGKRKNNITNKNTFCYKIEVETEYLGNIHSVAGVKKFGVWVDLKTQRYEWQKGYKKEGVNNEIDAFNYVKQQILKVIEYGKEKKLVELEKINLSSMFKGKILFLYYPSLYLNIFYEEWVNYYLSKLDMDFVNLLVLEKREILLKFKEKDEVMKKWNNFEFAEFLYSTFGKPTKKELKELNDLKDLEEQEQILKEIKTEPKNKIIEELKSITYKTPKTIKVINHVYKRDNKTLIQLKILREFKCQLCGFSILKKDGSLYVEASHITAKHERGSELPENILILCPNHHKEFDFGDRKDISRTAEEYIFQLNNREYKVNLKLE